jgi:hypothetical protein
MEKGEIFQLLGGVLVLGVFVLLNQAGVFQPGGGKAALETAADWWQANAMWVYAGLGVFNVVIFSFVGIRAWRARRKQAAIDARVMAGTTILLLPRSDWKPVDPSKVEVWARVADALPHDEHISFEVGGSDTELFFALRGSDDGARAAMTQIKSEWRGVQRRKAETDPAAVPQDWHIHWVELCPQDWKEPIQALSDDPLRSLLVEMNGVVGRGRGLLQVIARNDFGTRARLGRSAFAARAEEVKNAGVRALRTKEARGLEERAERTFLQVTVRCVGIADSEGRAQGIARGLARAVSASYGHRNQVKPVRSGSDPRPVLERRMGKSKSWADNELATLAHLTGGDMLFIAPRLKTASAKSLPPDPEMRVTSQDVTARFV